MAHIFADNVREGSVTEGTGDFVTSGGITSPGGVIIGRTLSEVLIEGDTFDYTIFHSTLNEWEIGVGTYISENTFSRDPSSSSNGGSLVSFSPGVKQVFIAPVAARMSDIISDDNLPHLQSGKTFTSTVSISGESGLRINYGDQSWSIGGNPGETSDFDNVFRSTSSTTALYINADSLTQGFTINFHDSGDNFREAFSVRTSGRGYLNGLQIKTTNSLSGRDQTVFPVGHTILVRSDGQDLPGRNDSHGVAISSQFSHAYVLSGGPNEGANLEGTWRCRGSSGNAEVLMERVL